jgi:hypothetical protein
VDEKRHSITSDGKEFPLPPDFADYSKPSTALILMAKNYCKNKLGYIEL